jgi:hypothetical protein
MPNSNSQKRGAAQPEKPPAKAEQDAPESADKPDGQKRKWDIIDEHAWESFPASDPPASWAGRDIAPQERAEEEDSPATRKLKKQKN